MGEEPANASSYSVYVYPSLDGVLRYEIVGDKNVRYPIEEMLQKDRKEVKIGIFMIRHHNVWLPAEGSKNQFELRELEDCDELDETLIPEVVRLVAECCPEEGLEEGAIQLKPDFHTIQDRFMSEILKFDLKAKDFTIYLSTPLSETYVTKLLQSDTLCKIEVGFHTFDGGFTTALGEPLREFILAGKNRIVYFCGSPAFDGDYFKDVIISWKSIPSPARSYVVLETNGAIKPFFDSWTTPSDNLDGPFHSYLMHDNGKNYVKIGCSEQDCELQFTNVDDEPLPE
ncbi:hypothetical protein QR680_014659 [Steinernema hermaphroditum]|uniref:Uncharacterized protein n=1 Tax=Steinernema hermaphroditum TaxID=289476 RepID=A0AA39I9P9_9BILA|nr:hypothetical protein QR680_014659 [Steinernema hermaphroditum]